jgi:antitoxin (DNA-binding transcriptional repressor) of toxin-antitoxin stability system
MLDLCGKATEIGLMKTMTISYFKAHISEQLRKVRKGARLVISDRDTPIAEVLPYRPESTRISVRGPLATPFAAPPSSLKTDHDPIEYLLEDRGRR